MTGICITADVTHIHLYLYLVTISYPRTFPNYAKAKDTIKIKNTRRQSIKRRIGTAMKVEKMMMMEEEKTQIREMLVEPLFDLHLSI